MWYTFPPWIPKLYPPLVLLPILLLHLLITCWCSPAAVYTQDLTYYHGWQLLTLSLQFRETPVFHVWLIPSRPCWIFLCPLSDYSYIIQMRHSLITVYHVCSSRSVVLPTCPQWEKLLSCVRLFETPWTVRLLRPWNFPGKDTGVGCHLNTPLFIYWIYITNNYPFLPPKLLETMSYSQSGTLVSSTVKDT